MNDQSSSWGSRNEREFGSSLSRMNSLAETKVLTSTLLVRARRAFRATRVFEFDEHFQYEQQIGSSQNSEVWLVTSKTSGRAFVVKKCLHAFTTDAQRAKLRREVEAAALLPEHPNIVRGTSEVGKKSNCFTSKWSTARVGRFRACLRACPREI